MITVACVLRSGGIYTPDWVRKLRDGVARHLSLPHRFVCLSDVDVPCERIPLIYDWPLMSRDRKARHDWTIRPQWWSKIELFRPNLFEGTVLYLDLDSVVVGSLGHIVCHPHRFTMAHDFNRPEQLCSTAMAWTGDQSFVIEEFLTNPDAIAHKYDVLEIRNGRIGDQAFIEDMFCRYGQRPDCFRDLFGEQSIASYKVHSCKDAPPPGASVVAFHGLPKPDAISTGWVPLAWN